MGEVAVVTDSTASLPPGLVEHQRIGVVPLHVVLGRRTGVEGAQISPAEVAAALSERRVEVSTSRPAPWELAAAYRASGAGEVVSVHLSAELSGTHDSAVLAAREVASEGITVTVVDSRTIAMGLGFAVLAAARAASGGAGAPEVEWTARDAVGRTTCLLYVDTLEHLRRGGRSGAAAAMVGTALAVKPLLHVVDGRIAPREKVRTASRPLTRLVELAVQAASAGPAGVAFHHLAAPARAEQLAERLRDQVSGLGTLHLSEVGAVVGAHVGPGALCVVVSRSDQP